MFYTGLFKRIIPFVLTFAAGLFIASIFVPLAVPNFSTWRESRRSRGCHEKRQLRIENDQLRERNLTLQAENEELKRGHSHWGDPASIEVLPLPDLDEHKPPHPPRKPKHPDRTNVLQ